MCLVQASIFVNLKFKGVEVLVWATERQQGIFYKMLVTLLPQTHITQHLKYYYIEPKVGLWRLAPRTLHKIFLMLDLASMKFRNQFGERGSEKFKIKASVHQIEFQ